MKMTKPVFPPAFPLQRPSQQPRQRPSQRPSQQPRQRPIQDPNQKNCARRIDPKAIEVLTLIDDPESLQRDLRSSNSFRGYRLHSRVRGYRMGARALVYQCFGMTPSMCDIARKTRTNFLLVRLHLPVVFVYMHIYEKNNCSVPGDVVGPTRHYQQGLYHRFPGVPLDVLGGTDSYIVSRHSFPLNGVCSHR